MMRNLLTTTVLVVFFGLGTQFVSGQTQKNRNVLFNPGIHASYIVGGKQWRNNHIGYNFSAGWGFDVSAMYKPKGISSIYGVFGMKFNFSGRQKEEYSNISGITGLRFTSLGAGIRYNIQRFTYIESIVSFTGVAHLRDSEEIIEDGSLGFEAGIGRQLAFFKVPIDLSIRFHRANLDFAAYNVVMLRIAPVINFNKRGKKVDGLKDIEN